MKSFDSTHLMLLMATVMFIALTMFLAYKLPRRWQTVLFIAGALVCAGGIFWRYALNMTLSPFTLRFETLLIQMLQVCNFNFVLVLLMLVPKCELARQYSLMFSMFAAATVMLSIPARFADDMWYSPDFLNFWLNHVFAIALPLWMLAAGRLKPQKKYILPVTVCVVAYFLIAFGCIELLRSVGKLAENQSFSYIHDPGGVGLLEWLHELIPLPFVYLLPLIPPMIGFFWALVAMFRNYEVQPFAKKREQ